MLKEFIAHIQKTTAPQIVTVDNMTFAVNSDGDAREIRPEIDRPEPLLLHSLDALVKLVHSEGIGFEKPLYITVPDHENVLCFGHPLPEMRFFRNILYKVLATDVPGWDTKVTLPFEEMQIALRTRFQETADTPYVQKLLSEISTGAKITFNDNGVATTIVTKKGIDLQANETIRPIVQLRPYRTFQEVDQPESAFLIRINERGICFIEADGGMWKLRAREAVKAFLEDELREEVESGAVIVAL